MGDDCPKLFNKWQPTEFNDFTLDDNGKKYDSVNPNIINQSCQFPFAYFNINFDYIYYTRQDISATQIVPSEHHTNVPFIFNKEILELFIDAKDFVQKRVNIASKTIPELSDLVVNKYSQFQRVINFEYTVNTPFKKVDLRNQIAMEVYLSLKEDLINKFYINKELLHPGNIMGFPIGTDEAIILENGINLNASGLPDAINAGTVYLSIYCSEDGSQEEFQKVFDSATNFIDANYKNKLRTLPSGSGLNFGLNGTGSYWNISLPKIKNRKMLPNDKSGIIQLPFKF